MSTLNPASNVLKQKPKSDSEKALDPAADYTGKSDEAEDIETDLARTAEKNNGVAKNDLLTETPLHGNTH